METTLPVELLGPRQSRLRCGMFGGFGLRAAVSRRGALWGAEGEAVGRVSVMPWVLSGLDPKPGELPMARLKPR